MKEWPRIGPAQARKMSLADKLFIGAVTILICTLALFSLSSPGPARTDTSTSVKVVAGSGHGSGVHIGNGYFLTASHVVLDENPNPRLEATIKLKAVTGEKFDPEVLWFNQDYDVALLYSPELRRSPSLSLTCRAPKVGDKLITTGNPFKLENISTWGLVGGPAQQVDHWRSVVIFNGAVLPGMSGGQALFADTRELAGIIVAVIGETSVGLIVPAPTLCNLMGRS